MLEACEFIKHYASDNLNFVRAANSHQFIRLFQSNGAVSSDRKTALKSFVATGSFCCKYWPLSSKLGGIVSTGISMRVNLSAFTWCCLWSIDFVVWGNGAATDVKDWELCDCNVCFFLCSSNNLFWENFSEQKPHSNGFSPVCCRECTFRLYLMLVV